jgi:hypothetical protein
MGGFDMTATVNIAEPEAEYMRALTAVIQAHLAASLESQGIQPGDQEKSRVREGHNGGGWSGGPNPLD